MTVNLRLFQKGISGIHCGEGLAVNEVIIDAVAFTGPRCSRGVRDGSGQIRSLGQQTLHYRGLTGAGRRGYDEDQALGGGR